MSNAPNPKRDEILRRYEREEAERLRRANVMARYLCGALQFFGIERAEAKFDGYGDDGSVEAATFIPDLSGELPFGLPDMIHRLCRDLLPGGWEINDGSFGTLVFDVPNEKVHVDVEWREEDITGYEEDEDVPIDEEETE